MTRHIVWAIVALLLNFKGVTSRELAVRFCGFDIVTVFCSCDRAPRFQHQCICVHLFWILACCIRPVSKWPAPSCVANSCAHVGPIVCLPVPNIGRGHRRAQQIVHIYIGGTHVYGCGVQDFVVGGGCGGAAGAACCEDAFHPDGGDCSFQDMFRCSGGLCTPCGAPGDICCSDSVGTLSCFIGGYLCTTNDLGLCPSEAEMEPDTSADTTSSTSSPSTSPVPVPPSPTGSSTSSSSSSEGTSLNGTVSGSSGTDSGSTPSQTESSSPATSSSSGNNLSASNGAHGAHVQIAQTDGVAVQRAFNYGAVSRRFLCRAYICMRYVRALPLHAGADIAHGCRISARLALCRRCHFCERGVHDLRMQSAHAVPRCFVCV